MTVKLLHDEVKRSTEMGRSRNGMVPNKLKTSVIFRKLPQTKTTMYILFYFGTIAALNSQRAVGGQSRGRRPRRHRIR